VTVKLPVGQHYKELEDDVLDDKEDDDHNNSKVRPSVPVYTWVDCVGIFLHEALKEVHSNVANG
jgi:hypothetical protein